MNAPKLIVEQCFNITATRWVFRIEDEEGKTVYTGPERMTKNDAIHDRSSMVLDAADARLNTDDPALRCARRGVYVTKDPR